MKEKIESTPVIPVSELIEESIYFSAENELIQVKKIDNENEELHLFNITQRYNLHFVKFENHNLIKKVR
jgi:exopolysaccharide biosynthesis predicted pyruvyltransferase EpsI